MDAVVGVAGVVLGVLIGWVLGEVSARSAATRAETLRKHEAGRELAVTALEIVRRAHQESWRRKVDTGSYDIETGDLRLDEAEAAIALIPDATLRKRLLGVLSAVRYPWNLDLGYPVDFQRAGLYRIREALAGYIREEPTPKADEALDKFERSVREHQEEVESAERDEREKQEHPSSE